jgi:hypothetical protein
LEKIKVVNYSFQQDCVEEELLTFKFGAGVKTKFQNEFCSNVYDPNKNDIPFGTCSSGRQSMGLCSNK